MYHQVSMPQFRGAVAEARQGPYWPSWPTRWETGLAHLLVPPGYNAWNRDPQSAKIGVNLATMFKRIEEIRRARYKRPASFFQHPCGLETA
jgi:hypothetical protein